MASMFSVLSDREGRLSSVTEGAPGVIGASGGDIDAKPLFELFVDDDQDVVRHALKSASRTAQTELSGERFRVNDDSAAMFDIAIEPAGPDRFWVRFTPSEGEVVAKKEDFLAAVAERLGLADGDDLQLLLIDFDGLRDGGGLGDDVREGIEGALSKSAVDGRIGRLDAGSYGVLGSGNQNKDDVLASAVEAAVGLGANESELGATSESVVLDTTETDAETVRGLLSHVCHKFYQTVRHGAAFGTQSLNAVSEEIKQAITLIEIALERGDVSVASRDVRQLSSGDVTVCLANGSLVFADEEVSMDRLLVPADHPDLCRRHDRAIVAAATSSFADDETKVSIIVDIGLPTLESGEAARIAAEMAAAGRTIGFRPVGIDMTDSRSRAVRRVYELLKDGVPVWLANFSTAISKTRRLKGAYVEVSATLLRDISAQPDRNKLLSGLLRVWHDVEVRLVAVNVDSKNLANFVNKLGIAYGIGIAADPAADAPQSTRDVAN